MLSRNYGIPVQRGRHVRVWLATNGLRPDSCPTLEGCIVPSGVSFNQNVETSAKKCPSIYRRGEFDIVYEVVQRDAPEISTTLTNRLSADMRSLLLRLARSGCSADLIYAYGICEDPNRYNEFTRLEIFQNVTFSNYQHDDVGAFDETTLTDDVFETVEVTASHYYDFARPEIRESVVMADVRALLLADRSNCGESGDCYDAVRSDGCQRLFAVNVVTTDVNLHYTTNGGNNWELAGVIPGLGAAGTKSLVASADILFAFSQATAAYSYAMIDDIIYGSPTWVTVSIPEAISTAWSDGTMIYMGGVSGQIYELPVTRAGLVPVETEGASHTSMAVSSSGNSRNYVVFGHEDGDVTVIEYGTGRVVTLPIVSDVNAVEVIDHGRFLSGVSTGEVYFTNNSGRTFSETTTFVAGVTAIEMANYAIGYANAGGHLYMTADGGCTWTRISDANTVLGASTGATDIQVCDDGNYVIYNGSADINMAEDRLRRMYNLA